MDLSNSSIVENADAKTDDNCESEKSIDTTEREDDDDGPDCLEILEVTQSESVDIVASSSVSDDTAQLTSVPGVSSDAVNELGNGGSGGRLRFFLAGRCVLELAHDTNDKGRPHQWTQMSSKSYYPRPATWTPSTVLHGKHERKSCLSSQGSSETLPKRRNIYCQVLCSPFAALRRCSPSHSELFMLSPKALRRAARNPSSVLVTTKRTGGRTVSRFGGHSFKTRRLSAYADKVDRLLKVVDTISSRQQVVVNKIVDVSDGISEAGLQVDHSDKLANKSDCVVSQTSCSSVDAVDTPLADGDDRVKLLLQSGEIPRKSSPPSLCSLGNAGQSSPRFASVPTDEKRRTASTNSSAESSFHRRPCESSQRKRDHSKSCDTPVAAGKVSANDTTSATRDGFNQKKRRRGAYGRGRTIGEAVRNVVIGEIFDLGGDPRTKYVPRGVFTEVGLRYKVDATTTYRWWLKYCDALKTGALSAAVNSSQIQNCKLPNATEETRVFRKTGVKLRTGLSATLYSSPPSLSSSTQSAVCHLGDKSSGLMSVANRAKPDVIGCNTSGFAFPQMEQLLLPSPLDNHESSVNSHSPMSNDSQSSSASIVDPAALYASFVHTSAFPHAQPMPPPISSAGRTFSSTTGNLPVGVCLPYVWSPPPPTTSSFNPNKSQANLALSPLLKKQSCSSSDEPLDLTVPKKNIRSDEPENLSLQNRVRSKSSACLDSDFLHSASNIYSEWKADPFVLKTLSQYEHSRDNLSPRSPDLSREKPISSHFSEGSSYLSPTSIPLEIANGHHRHMKPRHYPFLSLQIGTFEIHSSVSGFGDIPNKFKVIFTKRKFVYEFETITDGDSANSRQMACIVVPFSIVEGFWCCDASIVLQVISKPCMFIGQRHRQMGCVPSLTVYETKKTVDLTGGQLAIAHFHKVTLLKPHLVERLKIWLVLFDVRFRDLMAPPLGHFNLAIGERDIDE